MSQSFLQFLMSNPDQPKANGKRFLVVSVSNNQVCVADYDETVASRALARQGFNSPLIASDARDQGTPSLNSVINVKWMPLLDDDTRFDAARAAFADLESYVFHPVTVDDTAQQIADKNAANSAIIAQLKAKLV